MAARVHVVIIGAGFGGLNAAKRLERAAVDVTVVDRHNYHQFQPLLYQVATSGLNAADVAYAVRGMFRRQRRVLFRTGVVTGVDWDRREVLLEDEAPLPFDHLIVAGGSTTNFFGIPGAEDFAFPLYTLEDAVRMRNHVLNLYEAADAVPELVDDGILNFVVVGGGPTGVEVSGALAELIDKVLEGDFHDLDVHRSQIVLIEQAPVLLAAFSPHSQRYARRTLEERGVTVRTGVALESLTATEATLSTGEVIKTRCLVWAAGVQAGGIAAALGVEQGKGGRIAVGPDLSIVGHPGAFAVGDIADMDDGKGGRLPQLAQPAIQSGRHAADQILRSIERRPPTAFRYADKGTMATIGRRAAVAELPGGIKLTGGVAWLSWLALHLLYLLGVRNKISVFISWAWNYLTWDRGPRLILRPEALPQSPRRQVGSTTPADQTSP